MLSPRQRYRFISDLAGGLAFALTEVLKKKKKQERERAKTRGGEGEKRELSSLEARTTRTAKLSYSREASSVFTQKLSKIINHDARRGAFSISFRRVMIDKETFAEVRRIIRGS